MGTHLLSRRALAAWIAVACLSAEVQADSMIRSADPQTILATRQAQSVATTGTVHENPQAAAPLTPRAVAAKQNQRIAATSSNPPWYSLSRLKSLLPSWSTVESWIPGLKRSQVTVRTVPRVTAPAGKTTSNTLKPLAASQQPRISRTPAASTVSVPTGELIAPVPAPEPSTWVILALGGAGGWYWRSRRNGREFSRPRGSSAG